MLILRPNCDFLLASACCSVHEVAGVEVDRKKISEVSVFVVFYQFVLDLAFFDTDQFVAGKKVVNICLIFGAWIIEVLLVARCNLHLLALKENFEFAVIEGVIVLSGPRIR